MSTCVSNALVRAIARLKSTLATQAPSLSGAMHTWMCAISPSGQPTGHFEHPRMFPVLQLPAWVAESLGGACDPGFHEAVTYSTVCGYYCTRLIDNVMDGDVRTQNCLSLLPIAGVLASEFQFEYQRYFSPEHEFWNHFRSIWLAAAESASHDAALQSVSEEDFERISSQKFAAAKIPVVAACLYYERPDDLKRWSMFVDSLGRWSQMFDDLLDWHEDQHRRRATFLLTEGERNRRAAESLAQWIVREGNSMGLVRLNASMKDLLAQAFALGSASAHQFLQERQQLVRAKEEDLTIGYAALVELASVLQAT